MSLHQKDSGTRVTAANYTDVTDPVSDPDPMVRVLEDLIERGEYAGGSDATADTGDDRVTKAFRAGEVVRQSAILGALTEAVIESITPATGPAAGGTVVSIKGSGLDGVTGVTFGGTAGTALNVVDPGEVRVTTPAKSAGALNVAVTDDSGVKTVTNGYTYT